MSGWIGVDFDGTLATDATSAPIPAMVNRIKRWLSLGIEVRIVTARANPIPDSDHSKKQVEVVKAWCKDVFGQELPVTCMKDYDMYQLWDDRAVQVIRDTGERVGNENRPSAKHIGKTVIDEETGYIR